MNTLSHVAIIMDGNGRWAQKKNKSRKFGHLEGTKNIQNIIYVCLKRKISFLTLFAFGLDNWNRPKSETKYIFSLLKSYLKKNLETFNRNNIKIKFIGEIYKLPQEVKKIIKNSELLTKKNNALNLIVAINYSSRLEILNTLKKLIKKKQKKITIKNFTKNLYTSNIPDPDIMVRTGGHKRLSNFLLWQNSYTEFFFLKKYWPDFNKKDLSSIINNYHKIKRNFGSI